MNLQKLITKQLVKKIKEVNKAPTTSVSEKEARIEQFFRTHTVGNNQLKEDMIELVNLLFDYNISSDYNIPLFRIFKGRNGVLYTLIRVKDNYGLHLLAAGHCQYEAHPNVKPTEQELEDYIEALDNSDEDLMSRIAGTLGSDILPILMSELGKVDLEEPKDKKSKSKDKDADRKIDMRL